MYSNKQIYIWKLLKGATTNLRIYAKINLHRWNNKLHLARYSGLLNSLTDIEETENKNLLRKMKGNIVIFTVIGCPSCARAKGFLSQHKLKYIDINVETNASARQAVIELTGKKTVPQVFFNDHHVGGLDDLNDLSQEELDKLIKKVNENVPSDKALYLLEYIRAKDEEEAKAKQKDEEETGEEVSALSCEPDEYAVLVKEFRESGIIKDHKKLLKTVKNSFVGKEAVDWLVAKRSLKREAAIETFQQLIGRHFGHNVNRSSDFHDDDSLYRLLEDDENKSLNMGLSNLCNPTSASKLGEEIRQLILTIYNAHLSPDGKKVDYKSIGEDEMFKSYVKLTAQLQRVQLEGARREEKLAFFINIYNALVIHAFVSYGSPTNLWQRYKFFNTVSYVIGGHSYSLNDIENGILRSNRRAIGAFRKPFSPSDLRLKIALESVEPKIHFALVCGAKSCPPIKTYSAKEIDTQLLLAAESFLEGDGCIVDMKNVEVRVSQILKWYKQDFGSSKKEIVQFVHDHIGKSEKKSQLQELLQSGKFKLSYLPYDWGLNSK